MDKTLFYVFHLLYPFLLSYTLRLFPFAQTTFPRMSLVTYARSIMDDDHVERSSTYRVPVRGCHRLVGFVKQWHCKRCRRRQIRYAKEKP